MLSATMKVKGRMSGRSQVEDSGEITVLKPSATQKEVVKEVVLIPCKYCGGLMPQTAIFCPNCGARRSA
jgi:hypothetical protein